MMATRVNITRHPGPDWRWRKAKRDARAGRAAGPGSDALLRDAVRFLRWRAGQEDDGGGENAGPLPLGRRDEISEAAELSAAPDGSDDATVRHVVQALAYGHARPAEIAARVRRPAGTVSAYLGLFFDLPEDPYGRLKRLVLLTPGEDEGWYRVKLGCLWYGAPYLGHFQSGGGLRDVPRELAALSPAGPSDPRWWRARPPRARDAYMVTMEGTQGGLTWTAAGQRLYGKLSDLTLLVEREAAIANAGTAAAVPA